MPVEILAEAFYHKTGVLLFTSLWEEPFALTVLEAMSCGTLVAATDTGGTREIVTNETGIIFSPNAEKHEIIQRIFDETNDSPKLENARKKSQHYTLQQMARSINNFVFGNK